LLSVCCQVGVCRYCISKSSILPCQANPSDILLFHKKRGAESANGKGAAKKRAAKSLNIPSEPEELEEVNVEDLVNDNLFNSDKKLELLNEKDMAEGTIIESLALPSILSL
jgi:hypothetical protein